MKVEFFLYIEISQIYDEKYPKPFVTWNGGGGLVLPGKEARKQVCEGCVEQRGAWNAL